LYVYLKYVRRREDPFLFLRSGAVNTMEIMLDSLVRTYPTSAKTDVKAVQNISLTIPSNTVYGIIGKSGAGKSTLVRLMSLLEESDAGAVYYDGERVDDLTGMEMIERRRSNGMIFQNFNLFSSRNAFQNIAYPLEICGKSRKEINSRVEQLLELVGLTGRGSSPISQLSGGQKQRVAIARALANNPDILFCDEATSALDPQTTRSILGLIRDIQQKMKLTVIMITHQMEVVRDACDHVAVLDDGAVVEQGKVTDIFAHPKSEVTRDFLSHLPLQEETDSLVRWSTDGGEYELRFIGSKTGQPVLSQLARKFSIEFNIRAGGIQHLPDNDVGTLITDITGEAGEIEKALDYLRDQGILVERVSHHPGGESHE
jgi:D-methionine transport system ATP-binding protein